jgi:hypothetical protein
VLSKLYDHIVIDAGKQLMHVPPALYRRHGLPVTIGFLDSNAQRLRIGCSSSARQRTRESTERVSDRI